MKKKINLRKVKPTKIYKASELAQTLGISRQAIYKKIHQEDGLPVIDNSEFEKNEEAKVWLIYGSEFIDFEKAERIKNKPPRQPNKFWCFSCKDYQEPLGKQIKIKEIKTNSKKITEGTILLIGICPKCQKEFYQISNFSQLEKIKKKFKI